jgi:predicted TIM-barrel fold metal-dependent hydrolase
MTEAAYKFDPTKTRDGYGAIDIVTNFYTPQVIAEKRVPTDENFRDQVRMEQSHRRGLTPEEYIEKMDRAGIERSFLIATRCGDRRMSTSTEIPYEYVYEACKKYPHRYSGLAGIDPLRGIAGMKELDPHWFGQSPEAAIYYPYYARCAELGIPIMMQVGQCLVYRSDNRLATVAKPISLDRIAIDFPELTIIGIHLGYPWTEEMISVANKHRNVYMCGDAYAPKYWGPAATHFANSFGQDKFLFGTDWWVIDPERAIEEVHDLGFRPESKRKILRDNAMRIFDLKD